MAATRTAVADLDRDAMRHLDPAPGEASVGPCAAGLTGAIGPIDMRADAVVYVMNGRRYGWRLRGEGIQN